jgi:hypothetical protein
LSASFSLFLRHAARGRRLVKEHVPDELVDAAAGSAPTLSFYAIAVGVSIFFPVLAVALYFAIALYLTVPARDVRRLIRRSS